METIQKFAVPLAIVVAGGFIAVALYYSNGSSNNTGSVQQEAETVAAPSPLVSGDHVLGSRDAKLMIVEYSDTECPFCKQFHGTLQQVMESYSSEEVAWAYRYFPIAQLHQKANREAQALECAYQQGGDTVFWSFIDDIFATTPANDGLDLSLLPKMAKKAGVADIAAWQQCLDTEETKERVDRDYNEVVQAGGRGTPHTVVVSKSKLSKDAKQAISEIPPQLGISLVDDYSVFISGALPIDVVSAVLDIMLDKEPQ